MEHETGAELAAETDGSFILNAGESATVTIQKSAHSTAESGYARIIFNGASYTPEQINDEMLAITITPTEATRLLFLPCIGTNAATKKIKNGDIGVILLSEYHASSIRLWRVILLRSDIRLTPSVIRFASLWANRISL